MVMDSLAAELAGHLMPSHLHGRRGGRLPAPDPRTDRKLSQPEAQRILKNRLSAARSKLRSKTASGVCFLNELKQDNMTLSTVKCNKIIHSSCT